MSLCFGEFELDEERRELRLRGRELAVQPRVFDLLAYLVCHRDRVVGKEELLDCLWRGRVVVDGALQRVVSLARSVLQQGGERDAIRTYARRGYRFCLTVTVNPVPPAAATASTELERARQAFHRMDWDLAVTGFRTADDTSALAAADLERWAQAAQWRGDAVGAVPPLQRAVAAYLSRHDRHGAARAALLLAQISFERQENAVARGWHRRARTILGEDNPCRETGLHHYLAARMALFDGAAEEALAQAEQARALGVALEDPDLEGLGLLYSGHALLALGEVEQGLDHQGEAAAAALTGQVSAWAGALIYCGVVWACRNRADWAGAAEWTEQFSRWCEEHRMAAFPGTCRLHRAEVLGVRGEVEAAERELEALSMVLSSWAPWAEGDVHRVLGDLRLGKGDLTGAEAAYQQARELGWDPQPGYALLLLAQDRPAAAVSSLEATLAGTDWTRREGRGVLEAHLVLAAARAGDLERARAARRALEQRGECCAVPAVAAVLGAGAAELAFAQGRLGEAIEQLRQAAARWQHAGCPVNVAHLRLRLAQWLAEAGDVPGAEQELCLAEAAFRAVDARAMLDRCQRIRESWIGGEA